MTGPELDDGVRMVLETQFDSLEKLEIVRTLRAAGQAMSRAALEAACRFPSEMVCEVLASLERAAVIERDRNGELIRLGAGSRTPSFEAAMQLYDSDRVRVLSVLSSAAMARIRNMAARTFADAFMFRKKK